MKGKRPWLFISALVLGMCFVGTGVSWGDDASPPAAGAPAGGQTVAAPPAQAAPPADTGSVPTTEVTVTAEKEKKPMEGSAEAGYKVDNVTTTGPWGQMPLQDTPYSLNVIPKDLIENTISTNQDRLFRINPLTQVSSPADINNISSQIIRGFEVQDYFVDGIRNGSYGLGVFTEDLERVEVFSGLSGFLYGAGNVGGSVNYILKRPTSYYLNDITVGDYGGGQAFIHGDFGGPIDKAGNVAYRLNVMGSDGNTVVKDQSLKKGLVSGALDLRPSDDLLVQLNGSLDYYRVDGRQEQFYFAGLTAPGKIPSPPDESKLWAPDGTFNEVQSETVGLKTTYHVNDIFTFRGAVSDWWYDRTDIYPTTGDVLSNRTYSMFVYGSNDRGSSWGEYAYLDAKFDTFGVQHKLTFGVNGHVYEEKDGPYALLGQASGISFSDPASANIPILDYNPNSAPYFLAERTSNYNYLIGDDIKFTDKWSALIGINYSDITEKDYYGTNNTLSSSYDKSKATPSASLLFKPVPWITTYATYIEALEQGQVVPTTYGNFTNAGQSLPPSTDRQYELGAKATVGGMLLTAALFDIDKVNTFDIQNPNGTQTAVQDGREVHKGVEFTATGKVTEDLTILGGFTFFDAKVQRATTYYALNGEEPSYVSNQMAKVYAEYNLPFLKGLTLIGGVYYTGKLYVDPANTQWAPAVVLGDFGARYTTTIDGRTTIFRLYVSNVTNENYWESGGPLGVPRTISLSATVKF